MKYHLFSTQINGKEVKVNKKRTACGLPISDSIAPTRTQVTSLDVKKFIDFHGMMKENPSLCCIHCVNAHDEIVRKLKKGR